MGSKLHKSKPGFGINIPKILCVPIFRQNGELWIFGPKFAQKWILGLEFQNSKSGFGIKTCNTPCVPILSQNRQLLIFQPKFGEIAQLHAIIWFKYCWWCCRELGGDLNELGGGGWSWVEAEMSWVEVDSAGCRWMEMGTWFSNTHRFSYPNRGLNLVFHYLKNTFHFSENYWFPVLISKVKVSCMPISCFIFSLSKQMHWFPVLKSWRIYVFSQGHFNSLKNS